MGVYIDGGGRERMPYEADAYVQQISHYAVDREYAIQRYTTNFLIFNPSWPTEWHLHIVLMAWADYMATGDARLLETYYDELKKKTLLPLAREDGLISTRTGLVTEEFLAGIHYYGKSFRDIVDWPQGTPANESRHRSGHGSITFEGETDRYVFSDINTVVNAFHYRNLVLMGKEAYIPTGRTSFTLHCMPICFPWHLDLHPKRVTHASGILSLPRAWHAAPMAPLTCLMPSMSWMHRIMPSGCLPPRWTGAG